MASEVKADKLSPSAGTTVTLGDASDTITIPTGATLNVVDGVGVASGGTGLASFTAGDILYATGSTTLAKLAKGTAEQILSINSGATAPEWTTAAATAGGTGQTSFTAGDILYANSTTTLTKLGKGTGLQGLQTNSGATAPQWANSPQSVMTAAGDILYASGANTLAKLAKGSNDEVLTLAAGVPSWASAAGGGLCLQVVGSSKTDTDTYSTASWAAIPDMTLAITPTKASSKILVTVSCNFGLDDLGGAGKVMFDIDSGGYNDLLVGAAANTRTQASWGLRGAGPGSGVDSNYTTWMRSLSYLHTPSYTLTDVITYKVYWNATSGTAMYINRLFDDSDDANYVRVASSMTAMEID